ncbi:MAG: transcription-repair coupling factor [Candidatus Omnitrophica bacterium]|nr:transcription-repair coupling factor [Candidatus Omnitrophota bacterium]
MLNLSKLRTGQTISRDHLIQSLEKLNYRRQDFVSRPGDYSSRGQVVDVYPLTYQMPVRVIFQLDEIESIHDFSLHTGESLTTYAEVTLLPLNEMFARKLERYELRGAGTAPIESFLDIREGDYVVHLDYGVGRFLGFKRLKVKGEWKKHFAIEYAESEILYLETGGPKLLERYIGLEGKKPKLTKLHGRDWIRVKEKTRLAVKGVARDMLEIQAKRNLLPGFRYKPDTDWQKQFEEEFPYEETPDQLRATLEVKADMESARPMDRLLCGDVGYGKTEVALRAAFKAVMDAKQVAILVPTTILAEQHYLTLSERVKNYPVRVDVLSRFKSKGQQAEVVKGLKEGTVDIVIGTHRLLSRDVQFNDLGMVIIDEEQRFGVRHKERLKHLRALIDVLTLTATPIPRTLYLSLLGARDMSVISTPPQGRMPVATQVMDFNEQEIKKGFERELDRKGQIYFVHNRIETIERIHRRLAALLPKVRFAVAHGRLSPHALEDIMRRFIHGQIDCLISTNIIESGLDIPNVNTIMVNRADTFGLADLYQLRGRVGRFAKRQAYAYFILPGDMTMSEDAMKRIRALERFTELGSGFKIAMEDLEIRGAGNILGEEQSGFIYQVGFDLYCRFLQQAIQEEGKQMGVAEPPAGS